MITQEEQDFFDCVRPSHTRLDVYPGMHMLIICPAVETYIDSAHWYVQFYCNGNKGFLCVDNRCIDDVCGSFPLVIAKAWWYLLFVKRLY